MGGTERLEAVAKTLEEQLKSLREISAQLSQTQQNLTDKAAAVAPAAAGDADAPAALMNSSADGHEVQVALLVKGIFSLNTTEQTFGIQLGITMLWDCPDSESPPSPEEDDGDWEPDWTPKYRIKNLMDTMGEEMMYSLRTVDGKRVIQLEAEHLVTIYEQLELQSFPTDLQDLNIEIESKTPVERVKWIPPKDPKLPVARVHKEKCYLNDFSLIKECAFTFNMFVAQSDQREVSSLQVTVKVARKSTYYLINVNLLMMVICFFSLCAWSSHPADIANRQAIDFNLILTAVMFKLVLVTMLPPLSYVTTLDAYVLISFVLILLVTVSHSMLPYFIIKLTDNSPLTMPPLTYDLEERLVYADNVSFWAVLGLMVVFNFVYFVYFIVHKNREYAKFVAQGLKQQHEDFNSSSDEKINKMADMDTSAFAKN